MAWRSLVLFRGLRTTSFGGQQLLVPDNVPTGPCKVDKPYTAGDFLEFLNRTRESRIVSFRAVSKVES